MPLQKISNITGTCVVVAGDDVDTDRIIPARFMKCVTFDGLGEFLFYDVRFDERGNKKTHPLNDPQSEGATILIGGRNFGYGHPHNQPMQSMRAFGVAGVVAESFAPLFARSETFNGFPLLSCPGIAAAACCNACMASAGLPAARYSWASAKL